MKKNKELTFKELAYKLDLDSLLDLYKIYCQQCANTSNGKAYYFDDFIGWYLTRFKYEIVNATDSK